MAKSSTNSSSLSSRTLWTYTLGGVGRDMSYSLYSMFLLTFILFTKNLSNQQFAAISLVMVICRIWDAVNDPVMGAIIEKTKSKWGKFKPWILIGVLSNSVILVALFSVRITGWGFVVFFALMYLLWDITFTMNDIGYWSMLPALTSNMEDRNKLTSRANLFAGLGGVLTVALVPIFTAGEMTIGGSTVTAYAVITVVIAACFIGCQLMTVIGVQEPRHDVKHDEDLGFKALLQVIIKNDQLLWAALVMLLYSLGSAIITGLGTNYIYFQYGYDGSLVTTFTIIFGAASGIVMLLFPTLGKHFTRRKLMQVAITMIVIGYLGIFLLSYATLNFYVLCAMGLLVGLGQSIFYMVITINIANTVEYNEWKTGNRNEGIIFSIRPFTTKMGSALQQLVIMVVYLALGVTQYTNYISDAENAAAKNLAQAADDTARALIEQGKLAEISQILEKVPDHVNVYMRACMAFIPVILLGIAYIVLKKKCTIDEEMYNNMLVEIEQAKQDNKV